MIFWLFSGWLQKSGAATWRSISANRVFCLAASKIPPHGQGLFAEGRIAAFQFF
jgi:hypothetical protein